MTNQHQHESESKKNMQASIYTALVCGGILVLCLVMSWTLPPLPEKPIDEGIEVNLGNSDIGSGNDQPFIPNPPAASEKQAYTPPAPVAAKDDDVKDIETDDKDEEAPVIKKPPVVKKEATKVPEKEVTKTKPTSKPQPEAPPAEPVKKPKIVMPNTTGASNTKGGNDADSYKKGSGEGIAGGKGDQGAPGGDPDSKNYTGGGRGNSGVRIASGLSGRSLTRVFKYQDDFNENATVAVDVRIDKSGNVLSANYQLRGSTTSESFFKAKAVEIVKKSKFNAVPTGPDEQTGTVLVNFKVRG
jgi:outer membrane biosynthesis protein TonB